VDAKEEGGDHTPRWVGLTTEARKALEYAWAHRIKRSLYTFTNPDMVEKYPEEPQRWRWIYRDKFLKTLCRRAGVPPINFHEFRHETASTLADEGAGIADIRDVLGHEDANTTARYLHSLGRSVKGERFKRESIMALVERSRKTITSNFTSNAL
jgi:integrase